MSIDQKDNSLSFPQLVLDATYANSILHSEIPLYSQSELSIQNNTPSIHFRYAYRLSRPFTIDHPTLLWIANLNNRQILFISESTWYGKALATMRSFSLTTGLPWHERVLKLNEYILDGITPSGHPAGYQTTRVVKQKFLYQMTTKERSDWTAGCAARKAAEDTIFIRQDQALLDGNHRTAILILYESIADIGWCLRANPFDIYIIISNRRERLWNLVVQDLEDVIINNTVRRDQTFQQRQKRAEMIKNIPVINVAIQAMYDTLSDRSQTLVERREKFRQWKRQDQKMAGWCHELYPDTLRF